MKLSSCNVTSSNDLTREVLLQRRKGGIGGGGWVHPKGADSMAVFGLRFENASVGSESRGSLVPRLFGGGGKKEPGIYCLRMRLII